MSGSTATWRQLGIGLAVILILGFFPVFLNEYLLNVMIMTFLWIMLTVSLNLIGTMGYVCICIATFYGIGAYVSALLTMKVEMPFALSLLVGAAAAGAGGVLIGFPAFRVRGHYFAIATLAFALILSLVFSNWHQVTGGDRGITGIFSPFMTTQSYYYIMLAMAGLAILATHLLLHSRLGRQMGAIKEDEDLAKQMGINTMRVKMTAFVVGAFISGLSGGLMVHYINFIHPHFFTFAYSFTVIMGMIMGGVGTTCGAIIGGIIAIGLPELLRFTAGWRYIVIGFILVLIMLLLPRGIFGTFASYVAEKRRMNK